MRDHACPEGVQGFLHGRRMQWCDSAFRYQCDGRRALLVCQRLFQLAGKTG